MDIIISVDIETFKILVKLEYLSLSTCSPFKNEYFRTIVPVWSYMVFEKKKVELFEFFSKTSTEKKIFALFQTLRLYEIILQYLRTTKTDLSGLFYFIDIF